MSYQVGKIKESHQDARSGMMIFLSHCILNQNACVRGLASQPAVIRELVDMLLSHDVAFCQMPCPEITYVGSRRWGMIKEMYDTPMFRKHCRKIASSMCDLALTYEANNHHVLGFVMRDGSPTCGLENAAMSTDKTQMWGGMVWNANPKQSFVNTKGIYAEELATEIHDRGMEESLLYSIPEVDEAGSLEEHVRHIERCVQDRIQRIAAL